MALPAIVDIARHSLSELCHVSVGKMCFLRDAKINLVLRRFVHTRGGRAMWHPGAKLNLHIVVTHVPIQNDAYAYRPVAAKAGQQTPGVARKMKDRLLRIPGPRLQHATNRRSRW